MADRSDGGGGSVAHSSPVTQAGFTSIPNAVMLRKDIPPIAKLVYGYLKHLAWRTGKDGIDPPREVIAEDLGLSLRTVTEMIRALQKAPVSEGNPDPKTTMLVEAVRRGQGRTNFYLIHDPDARFSDLSRKGDSAFLDRQNLPFPISRGKTEKKEESSGAKAPTLAATPESGPPAIVLIEKQNVPLNTLCEFCGIDTGSPRITEAVAALNGKGIQKGIRELFWVEVERWADSNDRSLIERFHQEPVKFEEALDRQIHVKASRYREKMGDALMTPNALRRWWLDLDSQPGDRADMTPEEMRRRG